MLELIRTNAENPAFKTLVQALDAELKVRDGEDHDFYNQFNGLESIKHVLVGYMDDVPVACGAFKQQEATRAEIKRMYTIEASRGKGIAAKLLAGLEVWAKELSFKSCVLETGINQPEAIRLYQKCGYQRIENYGQYEGVEASFCFEKKL